ncbi:DUF192 domain-containing protein [Evansella sp. LMS18]|uniref:DUF192 domain-containing protein n=1 Tax=Evansella sp. LMS18 TaxID=2924033 RepID=UPI0020D08FC9|nr:DUF192 domain-containing protein [Evansella sp. LMS18]UTR11522.1 DUF192 domain-containing protein [Evansella sp. LMS18]
MRLLEKKENEISIPYNIKKADSFFTRLRGLMFRKEPLNEEGLWIIPCNSIHMCFMNFSIDAVFLDKDNKIVRTVTELKPWTFVAPVKGSCSVLELPANSIKKLKLTEGQHLILD